MRTGKVTIRGYRAYLLFTVLFYFFLLKDWLEQVVAPVKYSDEILALMAIPIFILRLQQNGFTLKLKRGGYGRYIILFLLCGMLSSVICRYQRFTIALADAFLCTKFWLTLYVGQNLFAKMELKRFGRRIYAHVKRMTLAYLLLFSADQAFQIFPTNIRYGMRSTCLMYSHPTVFAACCAFLIMVLLFVRDYAAGYKKWLAALLLLMCSTLRSKAFGTALVIALICYFVFRRKKRFRLRTLIIFTPLVIALGWEQIEYYFFSSIQSGSARYQLLIKSLEIAGDFFPLGTGFGTFASYYSGGNYSPVYWMYGLSNIGGLRQGATSFVSDSFWPMILGQTGLMGMTAYALALVMLFKRIQNIRKISVSSYASALSGMCYLLIASSAEAAFVHPVAIPIAMMIGFLSRPNRPANEKMEGLNRVG